MILTLILNSLMRQTKAMKTTSAACLWLLAGLCVLYIGSASAHAVPPSKAPPAPSPPSANERAKPMPQPDSPKRPPKRVEPIPANEYNEPLSEAEIEAMVGDGPLMMEEITNNQMMLTNGSMFMKSFMDATGPFVLNLLDRIDLVQSQLPDRHEVRLNTTDVRVRFTREWAESNSTYEQSKSSIAIKSVLSKIKFDHTPEQMRRMDLKEQIRTRNAYALARNKLIELRQTKFHTTYKETTDNSISVLYKTVYDLMSVLKDLRFQITVERTSAAARERFNLLMQQAEAEYLVELVHPSAPNSMSMAGRYHA